MGSVGKTVYDGNALSLKLEQVTYPDGSSGTLEIVRHPGGAGAVALNKRNEVCLIRQYRFATDGWLWEIPAGRIDYKENPIDTARRELEEEAGISASNWKLLGSIYPSPGICDEKITLYIATDLSEKSIEHEEDEYIEIHWVPFEDTIGWIYEGKITDAKTIVSLFCAQKYIT